MNFKSSIFRQTRIFMLLKVLAFSMTGLLLISLLVIDFIEHFVSKYIGFYFAVLMMVFVFMIVVKKYRQIGQIVCTDNHMEVMLNNKMIQADVVSIPYAKINVVTYRGGNAGLSGLVTTGYENNITVIVNGERYFFHFYINDRNERKRVYAFFERWKIINPQVDVRFPIEAT